MFEDKYIAPPIRELGLSAKDKCVTVTLGQNTVFWLPKSEYSEAEPLRLVSDHQVQFNTSLNVKIDNNRYVCVSDWNDVKTTEYELKSCTLILPRGLIVRLKNNIPVYLAADTEVEFDNNSIILLHEQQQMIQPNTTLKFITQNRHSANVMFFQHQFPLYEHTPISLACDDTQMAISVPLPESTDI